MRTRFILTALPALCSGILLLGCSSLASLSQDAPAATVASADEQYLRGRNLHLARRYDAAIAAYQLVLQGDPGHLNARNGLAIAYAERRDFARAIPIWRELTQGATMGSGQGAAFLFGNLGYAYFLSGDYDEALVALEKACLLDPLNARSWQYLGETLQKLGQEERARQMLDQARALREHDFHADYAAAGGGTRMPAIERAVQAPQETRQPERDWAAVEVTPNRNGILELRRVEPASRQPKTPGNPPAPSAPAPGPSQPAILATLEISNGNGRQGMARQLSLQLRDPGVRIVRLTNEKGFKVRVTRVEYQPAYRTVAERLAQRFGAVAPVEVGMGGGANVRLVIGHDLQSQRIAGRSDVLPVGHANSASLP